MNLNDALNPYPFFQRNFEKIDKDKFIIFIKYYQAQLKKFKNKKVIITLEEPVYFSAALFAAISLKVHVVFLPNYKMGSLEYYKDEYDFILTTQPISCEESNNLRNEDLEINLENTTALTFFTSGSTSEPKKILKFFNHLLNEVMDLSKQFHILSSETFVLSTVSHFHIYGLLFRILLPILTKNSTANFTIEFEEELSIFEGFRGDLLLITGPSFLKRINCSFSNIKFQHIFSSGGVLDFEVASAVKMYYGLYPSEIYGSTETGGIAYRSQNVENTKWTPLSSVQISIGDNQCLEIFSPYILGGRFLSSDRVLLDQSHEKFELIGRDDRVFKIEEKKINLFELEKRIKQHSNVEDAYCIVLRHGVRDYIGCIIAEFQDEDWANQSKIEKAKILRNYFKEYFDGILVPKKFRFIKELPYNEQSKLPIDVMRKYFEDR